MRLGNSRVYITVAGFFAVFLISLTFVLGSNLTDSSSLDSFSDDFFNNLLYEIMAEYEISEDVARLIIQQNYEQFGQMLDYNESDTQRRVTSGSVFEQETPFGFDFYVELGDTVTTNLSVTLVHDDIFNFYVNQPMMWQFNLIIQNLDSQNVSALIDLSDYYSESLESIFQHARDLFVYFENNLISQSEVFYVDMVGHSSKQLSILVSTSPIFMDMNCESKIVLDLIPSDAQFVDENEDLYSLLNKSITTCEYLFETDFAGTYNNIYLIIDSVSDGDNE